MAEAEGGWRLVCGGCVAAGVGGSGGVIFCQKNNNSGTELILSKLCFNLRRSDGGH
jgi:hypothetical protein